MQHVASVQLRSRPQQQLRLVHQRLRQCECISGPRGGHQRQVRRSAPRPADGQGDVRYGGRHQGAARQGAAATAAAAGGTSGREAQLRGCTRKGAGRDGAGRTVAGAVECCAVGCRRGISG